MLSLRILLSPQAVQMQNYQHRLLVADPTKDRVNGIEETRSGLLEEKDQGSAFTQPSPKSQV